MVQYENKEQNDIKDIMREFLLNIAKRKLICDVDIPNYGIVKAEILGVDLQNINWKPVHVKFSTKLQQKINDYEDNILCDGQHLVEKIVDYTDDWVDVRWLKNFY